MDKKRFKDLLTDLYEKYNPDHLVLVDDLVQRYHDTPYSAIDIIFVKYNHPSRPHYDPIKSTTDYKMDLLKAYEAGARPFRDVDLKAVSIVPQEPAPDEREEVKKFVEEKMVSVDLLVAQKVEEALSKAKSQEDIDFTVTTDNIGEEVIMPNKWHLASLGINARLILRTKSGKTAPFIVKDIIYDSFSFEDKALVMIHLEKA